VKPTLVRLLLAAVLFTVWIGYLIYLVHKVPRSPDDTFWTNPVSVMLRPARENGLPIVLSRPQILVSTVDVIGTVNVKDGTVQVKDVLFAPKGKRPEKGDEIQVTNLGDVKPSLAEQKNLNSCLLPLETHDDGMTFRVVHVPPSPGFSNGDARIYPATAETLAEYRAIQKP